MDESGTTVTTRHAVDASPFLSSSSVIAVEHHVPTMNYDRMRRELLRFLEAAPLDWYVRSARSCAYIAYMV